MGREIKKKEEFSPYRRCNLACNPKVKEEINACNFKRGDQTIVKKIYHGPTYVNGQIRYNVMTSRFLYLPLFQDPGISKKKILKDLIINCSQSVYNGREKFDLLDRDGNQFQLEHLRGQMYCRVMMIQICKPELLKKEKLLPADILIDPDDEVSGVCEGITLHDDGYLYIETGTDDFEEHPFQMCHDFYDEPVSVCSEYNENIVFDKGMFAIFIYRIYMPSVMSARRLKYESDEYKLYDFGEEFDFKNGDVGYSVVNELEIRYSYEESVGDGVLDLSSAAIQDILERLEQFRSSRQNQNLFENV